MSSYVNGASTDPLLFETIGQCLDRITASFGEREAIVVAHQNIRWTYRELNAAVDAFAVGLLAIGLQPGERIGIWSPNNIEWVVTQFATAKAGLILVNINPAYRTYELEYALNKVACKALILADHFKSSDYMQMLRELAPEIDHCAKGELRAKQLPQLHTLICISNEQVNGAYNFSDITPLANDNARQQLAVLANELQPDDAINIQFTSGTTGMPKGATLSHFNIINNGYFVGRAMNFSERDRLCIPVPLYHCFGMVMGVLTCTTHGATMVFPSDAFEPGAVLKAITTEKCTALHGVPTMFIAELEHDDFKKTNFDSLRTGIMAGAPCPIEVMNRVINEMQMSEVTIAYGMTETSPVSFQSGIDAPLDKRVSTVGRIHPHVEVKIIDENRRIVPRGTQGELCTRGYSVMQGYWEDEEKTNESIDPAGWMYTGDLAVIDDEGYCKIVGRVKDMIIRGGENVYPREIEEFLYGHPKIQDVAVFGVPDEKYGEQIATWIKLREDETATEEDIKSYCSGKIAHYKVPYYVRFVDDFPMTITGKIQKFIMREQMSKELGLTEKETA